MAKGKFHGMGGMPNMNSMINRAQKMQAEMQKKQEDIENSSVEGTSGGGAVTVTMSGKRLLTAVNIKPEACDPDDIEMLQDLIIAAVNDAVTKWTSFRRRSLKRLPAELIFRGCFNERIC